MGKGVRSEFGGQRSWGTDFQDEVTCKILEHCGLGRELPPRATRALTATAIEVTRAVWRVCIEQRGYLPADWPNSAVHS